MVDVFRKASGNNVAHDILLDGIRSMNYYDNPDSDIIALYSQYGSTEGFWAMMDRLGY